MISSNSFTKDEDLVRCNDVHLHMTRLKLRGTKLFVANDSLEPQGYVIYNGKLVAAKGRGNKRFTSYTLVKVVDVHAGVLIVDASNVSA